VSPKGSKETLCGLLKGLFLKANWPFLCPTNGIKLVKEKQWRHYMRTLRS